MQNTSFYKQRIKDKEFRIILDYRKTLDVPSQYRIAQEIRDISLDDIGFNQSMVSRMYNNIDIPKCDKTLTAIKNWINKELERKEKYKNLDYK
ncbi:hypothetical protein RhiirC2_799982 [Rhizophagus irregularis]|uniref:Uncharacterized protein n=1 Tax=Rhizophagus irregularis TaxID=588596 RepID=A0A2N1M4A9_9GLOM|nr:hypothetical protein RhiirC2_799982 [Rhizophagus irregularis]